MKDGDPHEDIPFRRVAREPTPPARDPGALYARVNSAETRELPMRRQGLVRRASGAVAVLCVPAMLAVLAGCGSSESPGSSDSPSASGSSSSSSSQPTANGSTGSTPVPSSGTTSPSAPADRPGTCLGPQPGKPNTKVPVACTEPHDLEVAAPLRTKASSYNVAHAEAEQTCRSAGAAYLGSPYHASTRLRVSPGMPSREGWTKGQRGGSCLVEIHSADQRSFVTQRGSVRNALAGAGLHTYRLCGVGKANDAGRLVSTSCDRPHRSEALPFTVITGVATDRYPGRQVLNRQVGPQCRQALREFLGLNGYRPDIQAGWRMPTQTQWATGSRTATCYADLDLPVRKTARSLGPRPLTTLR